MKRSTKILMIIGSIFIISLVTLSSYAYFTANVNGNNSAYNTVIKTGYMEIKFVDGEVIGSLEQLVPGSFITKEFSVSNTGNLDTVYNIYLNDVINRFDNRSDLVCEIIDGTGSIISEGECPYDNSALVSNISIGVGETQHYSLKVIFKETNVNQNNNLGASFSAKIGLEAENNLLKTTIIKQKVENTSNLMSDHDVIDMFYTTVVNQRDYNLRYVGATPSNYIYFNCDTTNAEEMNDETCEKWRIVGIIDSIYDSNSKEISRVKIVKDEPLGSYSWDTSASSINMGKGINQWGKSGNYAGSDLMRELNTDYLGNITVGTDGKWYNGENNQKDADMPSKLLNQNSQNMIENVKWMFGNASNMQYQGDNYEMFRYFVYENSDMYNKLCRSGEYCNDSVARTGSWNGKVGLLNISDYGLSSSGNENKSRIECMQVDSDKYNESTDCLGNQWMFIEGEWQWTLNIDTSNKYASLVDYIARNGSTGFTYTSNAGLVRPVVYLKDDIKVLDGDGTSSNPFKLIQ